MKRYLIIAVTLLALGLLGWQTYQFFAAKNCQNEGNNWNFYLNTCEEV